MKEQQDQEANVVNVEFRDSSDRISQAEMQAYVTDYWLIMSREERQLAISEGFVPPNEKCELIDVEFVCKFGIIGWKYI